MDKERPKTAEAAKSAAHNKAKSSHTRAASSNDLPASRKAAAANALRDVEASADHAKEAAAKTIDKHAKQIQDNAATNIPLQQIPTTSTASAAVNAPHVARKETLLTPPTFPHQIPTKPWWSFCYDKQKKTYCGRTCLDWALIISYTIMYMVFLSTYTMIFLYASLRLVKMSEDYMISEKSDLYSYESNGIGLTATPTSEHSFPLIWFRRGDSKDYGQYVDSLDALLGNSRRKREASQLGPCGTPPYGYGESPCVVVRVNKQIAWAGKPMHPGSELAKSAPPEIQKLLKLEKQKLWFHCSGYYPWDREHIGEIKYYPDPPGFDPGLFPLNMSSAAPMLSFQLTEFTLGISLAVECKLWYNEGPSSFHFVLYVEPQVRNKSSPDFS